MRAGPPANHSHLSSNLIFPAPAPPVADPMVVPPLGFFFELRSLKLTRDLAVAFFFVEAMLVGVVIFLSLVFS